MAAAAPIIMMIISKMMEEQQKQNAQTQAADNTLRAKLSAPGANPELSKPSNAQAAATMADVLKAKQQSASPASVEQRGLLPEQSAIKDYQALNGAPTTTAEDLAKTPPVDQPKPKPAEPQQGAPPPQGVGTQASDVGAKDKDGGANAAQMMQMGMSMIDALRSKPQVAQTGGSGGGSSSFRPELYDEETKRRMEYLQRAMWGRG